MKSSQWVLTNDTGSAIIWKWLAVANELFLQIC